MSLSDFYLDVELDPMLDTSIFVSPPSSLSLASPTYANEFFAVCKKPEVARVKEGRIDFQYRNSIPYYIVGGIAFRIPSNSAPYLLYPCYVIQDGDDFWHIRRWDGLDLITLGEWPYGLWHEEWGHMRASWWEEAGTLRVRLEYEEGGIWTLAGPDIDTHENYNNENTIQAVGLMVECLHQSDTRIWFDDVKIERLVSSA